MKKSGNKRKRNESFENDKEEQNRSRKRRKESPKYSWMENVDIAYKDCIGDENDQEYLDSLKQYEREKILFHRWEQLQDNKISSSSSSSSSTQGVSSFKDRKSYFGGYTKYESKKEQEREREKKKEQMSSDSDDESDESDSDDGDDSSSSSEDEDNEERKEYRRQQREQRKGGNSSSRRRRRRHKKDDDSLDVGYEDILECVVKRNQIMKNYDEPFFEQMCVGSFVRAFLGENKAGDRVYRLAQIHAILNDNRGYMVDGFSSSISSKGSKKVYKRLDLSLGGSLKSFRINQISNEKPSFDEYKIWLKLVQDMLKKKNKNVKKPTKKQLHTHYLNNIKNIRFRYRHTNEEITNRMHERIQHRRFGEMTTLEINELEINLKKGIEVIENADTQQERMKNAEKLKKLKEDLNQLQQERSRRSVIEGERSDSMRKLSQIAHKKNQKFYLMEKKRSKNKKKAGGNEKYDPFARTETVSTFLPGLIKGHNEGVSQRKKEKEKEEQQKRKEREEQERKKKKEQAEKSKTKRKKKNIDQESKKLEAAHQISPLGDEILDMFGDETIDLI